MLDSLVAGRDGDELFRVARLVLDGYQRVTPLETDELRLIGELWAARAAVGIAIASWRSAEGLEDAEFAERYNESRRATLETILDDRLGRGLARRLGATSGARPDRAPA